MQARSRGADQVPVEVVYVIPREGAPLYVDMVAIPVDAPHPNNAHAFLEHIMEPKVIAAITNVVRRERQCSIAAVRHGGTSERPLGVPAERGVRETVAGKGLVAGNRARGGARLDEDRSRQLDFGGDGGPAGS